MTIELETHIPPLPYRTNALEPFMSKNTFENMYKALLPHYIKAFQALQITDSLPDILLSQGAMVSSEHADSNEVLFYTGALYNYSLFLPILHTPSYKIEHPNEESHLAQCIKETWPASSSEFLDSFSTMYSEFMKKAMKCLGNGWVFLTYNVKRKKLYICSFEKHENPLYYVQDGQPLRIPIFAINLWEHSYYLQYEYRKSDYLKNIWFLIHWKAVEQRFVKAQETLHPLQVSVLYSSWSVKRDDSSSGVSSQVPQVPQVHNNRVDQKE